MDLIAPSAAAIPISVAVMVFAIDWERRLSIKGAGRDKLPTGDSNYARSAMIESASAPLTGWSIGNFQKSASPLIALSSRAV